MNRIETIDGFRSLQAELADSRKSSGRTLVVSSGTCGIANGSRPLIDALEKELKNRGLADEIALRITGCLGFCQIEPLIIIEPEGILYTRATAQDAAEIVEETIIGKKVIDRLLYVDTATGTKCRSEQDIPFYNKQTRIISGNNVKMDPTRIEDYIAIGGYEALAKVLAQGKPEQIIETIKKSGLRGRGGAGFPAGVKWESCRKAHGEVKYVICNADEGDPGAYANRGLLEGNPHSVIEGMIIGAYAVGACLGFLYVRNEYPLAVELLHKAIEDATEGGFLGRDILGSDFDFTISISRGGGAFVCGESTALMASLEGQPGEPRAKYIHTVEKGAWGRPSCLNNVETWANVPLIINKGIPWYTSIGTGDVSKDPWGGSKGTKIFSLVGKINNTGLVEVPMGISLRKIVEDIGGGVRGGKRFKAIQTGGPSGGCIPENMLDLPVDFDRLTEAGSMMGSGGMIVMDENNCMVDVARYFLNFLKEESCGKCVPCREGVERMTEILTNICDGKGNPGDIELLLELAECLRDSALCQLGVTSPNPVLTTLKYFKDEYEAHIKHKKCPAGVCKALITYSILTDKCTGCGACLKACPQTAITGEKKKPHMLDQKVCIKCGICHDTCKFKAVAVA
ncbi:MAG: NADH-ubiquinone oxidoreductase-F iron-sulfur binding region domain-containing protein [Planctomycetota bacterium]|nr:NADH-ubiquinone oxidoreductase-F iron-sulfur binding region domain-containing protein [Planctomycetota bacterium]